MNGQFGMGMPMNNMPMNMNMMGGMPMNMNMNMNMMGGMPMNMNMNMNNQDDDEDWMQGFKMGVEEVNNPGGSDDPDLNKPGPKINVLFTTTIGTKRNVILTYGTTIDQALRKYLDQVGKSDLVNSDQISFLYNAAQLKFGDNTKIENFFKNMINPKVVVNDTHNLIGA